jgi:hypothetical protein
MDMSFKFLLQVIKILTDGNFVDRDLFEIYEFLLTIDNNELIQFSSSNNVMSYSNDLMLFIDILNKMIKLFEDREEYERCAVLKIRIDESNKILKIKTKKK